MPYVTVLPMKGNQWKTTGGSLGFLSRICFKTLRTTERTMTPKPMTKTWDVVPSLSRCWDAGPATCWRRPMVAGAAAGAAAAGGDGRVAKRRSGQARLFQVVQRERTACLSRDFQWRGRGRNREVGNNKGIEIANGHWRCRSVALYVVCTMRRPALTSSWQFAPHFELKLDLEPINAINCTYFEEPF